MTDDSRLRDAWSLLMVGGFFALLALLVLVGTWWTLERPRAAAVNVVAGLLLMAIGLGMIAAGRHLRRPSGAKR